MKKFHLGELKDFKNILDTGCGSGNLTLGLLEEEHIVTAIDSNEFALKILKKKCSKFKDRLKVIKMDAQEISLEDKSFDGASSMIVIPFVRNNKKYFSGVYKVLKGGGKFSISAWAPVKDSWHGIMELQKQELTRKGILPKYKKEWDYQTESAKKAIKIVLSGPNLKKLKSMLKKAGFVKINVLPDNPFGKYAYFLTCEKPKTL
jgi:ubiquinone/menaquinone biosynthesis C-methylase UbiE